MTMEYQEILDYVGTLDFAGDPHVADSMVQTVLGILFSSVDESAARHLAEHLPEPLTVEALRGHAVRKDAPAFQDYVREVRKEFGLSDDQAFELIDHVARVTHEAVGEYAWNRFVEQLPAELSQLVRKP
jgi:uncharacterized protein (DUF2267 family)